MTRDRIALSLLTLSASAFVTITLHEGWSPVATPPVPGDVPTYGFGTTTRPDGWPLKPGETITPPQAVRRALTDINRYEGALKECVRVPLHQYEYDAYISLAYNIGPGAFCQSTLVRKLNTGDYVGACAEILRWNKFQGQELRGLTVRRQAEHRQCTGIAG